jgi:hypothetical protein
MKVLEAFFAKKDRGTDFALKLEKQLCVCVCMCVFVCLLCVNISNTFLRPIFLYLRSFEALMNVFGRVLKHVFHSLF